MVGPKLAQNAALKTDFCIFSPPKLVSFIVRHYPVGDSHFVRLNSLGQDRTKDATRIARNTIKGTATRSFASIRSTKEMGVNVFKACTYRADNK